jgi:hypothetical protein
MIDLGGKFKGHFKRLFEVSFPKSNHLKSKGKER